MSQYRAETASAANSATDLVGVVQAVLALLPERPFAVRLPDGTTIPPQPAGTNAQFTLVLKRPSALRRMFFPPSELALGESFIFDDYDIEGDMVAAFGIVERLGRPRISLSKALSLGRDLWRLERGGRRGRGSLDENGRFAEYAAEGRLHSHERDRQAVQFHYDLSNDFYKLWLDERMVYSCAYFASEDESLDAAQERKLDRICRKLDLQPGERFLDIGCGWGGLLIHAVTRYGVDGTGISLSDAQTAEARARFEALGISNRCCIKVVHYEEFPPEAPFDKIASVGMFEHVGEEKLGGYFAGVHGMLKPGGLFILQGGASQLDRRHAGRGWMDRLGMGRSAFMQKYSFPDSRVIPIPTVLRTAELNGFETRDVESMREHYPLTLRRWLQRLEEKRDAAVAEVGEAAYRSWRLILAGYIYLIDKGQLSVYQTLLAKPLPDGRVELPLMRGDLF